MGDTQSVKKSVFSEIKETPLTERPTDKVTSPNSLRIVLWIIASVSGSTELVASSSIKTLRFLTKARHKATSCLSPPLFGVNAINGKDQDLGETDSRKVASLVGYLCIQPELG
jgi:hypothetical protein